METENGLKTVDLADIDHRRMFSLKRKGFSDERLAVLLAVSETKVRQHRHSPGCARSTSGWIPAPPSLPPPLRTMYSTYEEECEAAPTDRDKILVIGGGPNRIGQGIEFDYCCVHAALAMREDGYEAIMINCNPETVSTDYDTSDRLYFEPVTRRMCWRLSRWKTQGRHRAVWRPDPAELARALRRRCVPIIGTTPTPSTGPRTGSASSR